MMIMTAKVSPAKVLGCALAAALVVLGGCFLMGRLADRTPPVPTNLTSNEDRVAYLNALGWEVDPEPVETLQFLLPETLEEPYLSYNALQIPQGFDLSAHCGETVTRWTYTVTNYPGRPNGVQANLYIAGETPVAGDIFCPGADGFQTALIVTD